MPAVLDVVEEETRNALGAQRSPFGVPVLQSPSCEIDPEYSTPPLNSWEPARSSTNHVRSVVKSSRSRPEYCWLL